MITIAFCNSKAGVGKTSLVYHLAWMFSDLGLRVVAADLDPQANLTSMFLNKERLEELWPAAKHPLTIQGVIDPILRGFGDIQAPYTETINDRLHLLAGDLGLCNFEDKLSEAWPRCYGKDEAAFQTTTALYRALLLAGDHVGAQVVLIDIGPNLGAINRAVLIASQHVVIPLASDLYSLQGLRNIGPQLRLWRNSWQELKTKSPDPDLTLPTGEMTPAGYVVLQHAIRTDVPVKAYLRWMGKIPAEYRTSVLSLPAALNDNVGGDTECLATLRSYRSLMPLAMEAHKPMFFLKPADGAIGAHGEAVRDCLRDFRLLAHKIAERCSIPVPTESLTF